MTQVTITQQGEPNEKGDAWSYRVHYYNQRADEELTVRARSLDRHYLLEGKLGRADSKPFNLFGVEDLTDYKVADKRLYERAKERAEQLMKLLTPELVEETSRTQEKKSKK